MTKNNYADYVSSIKEFEELTCIVFDHDNTRKNIDIIEYEIEKIKETIFELREKKKRLKNLKLKINSI